MQFTACRRGSAFPAHDATRQVVSTPLSCAAHVPSQSHLSATGVPGTRQYTAVGPTDLLHRRSSPALETRGSVKTVGWTSREEEAG